MRCTIPEYLPVARFRFDFYTSLGERAMAIRSSEHTVMEAIERQTTHYAYHVGQIVYIARMLVGPRFKSLSIPRGQSAQHTPEPDR